jgi:hypothetical protein
VKRLSICSQLEKNLDAQVYTASNMEQITTFKVLEITALYNPAPIYEETALMGRIREKIGSIPKFSRCFTVARDILAQLGPWCCDVTWKYMLSGLERRVARQTQDLGIESLLEDDLALKNAHELVDDMEIPRNPDIYDISLFSPKITKLMQILQVITSGMQQFCGIVFVERRNTAVAIQLLIQSLDSLSRLRADILTGHGSSEEGDMQMHFKEQNKTIQKFRTGEINLLIATNVAEEGLDIQPCNFVIRYKLHLHMFITLF